MDRQDLKSNAYWVKDPLGGGDVSTPSRAVLDDLPRSRCSGKTVGGLRKLISDSPLYESDTKPGTGISGGKARGRSNIAKGESRDRRGFLSSNQSHEYYSYTSKASKDKPDEEIAVMAVSVCKASLSR